MRQNVVIRNVRFTMDEEVKLTEEVEQKLHEGSADGEHRHSG